MHEVYLSLGSNLGDRLQLMQQAADFLQNSGHFEAMRFSSLYETEPVGYTDQPPFINAVFRGLTALSPRELLRLCQDLEQELNRVRLVRWGPRTMDADILLYDTMQISDTDLEIPHPRMFERSFVLIPLTEICSPETAAFYDLPGRLQQLPEQGIRKLESYETTVEWHKTKC